MKNDLCVPMFVGGVVFGAVLAAVAVAAFVGCYWRGEIIRRGHAEYNQQTGAWQWKGQGQ